MNLRSENSSGEGKRQTRCTIRQLKRGRVDLRPDKTSVVEGLYDPSTRGFESKSSIRELEGGKVNLRSDNWREVERIDDPTTGARIAAI